jgi:hypothetical protein
MNEFENLIHQQAAPFLQADEGIEGIARLYTVKWFTTNFMAGVTRRRLVLVEVGAGALRLKPIPKNVREIHFSTIASVKTRAFFNDKTIVLALRSGETLTFGLNTIHRTVSGQKRFIKTLKDLYDKHTREAAAVPDAAGALGSAWSQALAAPGAPALISSDASPRPLAWEASREQLRMNQNFGMGVLAGVAAAGLAAVTWSAITIATEFQISWMAIGVGIFVGSAVRFFGRGVDRSFGFAAGLLSLAGCAAGNLLWAAYYFAQGAELPIPEALALLIRMPDVALELMRVTFSIYDIVFYALAAITGFGLGFHREAPTRRLGPSTGAGGA